MERNPDSRLSTTALFALIVGIFSLFCFFVFPIVAGATGAVLGFVALLFLLAAMADPYTGPERCGACHAEQYRKQSASHHASALRPIAGELGLVPSG